MMANGNSKIASTNKPGIAAVPDFFRSNPYSPNEMQSETAIQGKRP